MGLNTGAVGADRGKPGEGSTDYYGHADYERDQASGMSDAEMQRCRLFRKMYGQYVETHQTCQL